MRLLDRGIVFIFQVFRITKGFLTRQESFYTGPFIPVAVSFFKR
jgi:hypothetical protein